VVRYFLLRFCALPDHNPLSMALRFLEHPRDYTFSFQIIETPFWVVQKTIRAASKTDLMIVLLVTAVTLSSVLKVVVKVVIKMNELTVRLRRHCQASKMQDFDSDTSSLLTSDAQ
jgi:hypothetical protein